jgi:YVTN family beta-propeller protein
MTDIEQRLRSAMHAAVDGEDLAPEQLIRRVVRRSRRHKVQRASGVMLAVLALAIPIALAVPGPRNGHTPAIASPIGVLPRVLVGNDPQDALLDPANGTVYVANQGSGTISVVNSRQCNARVHTGCGRHAPAFPAGHGPFSLALVSATHTLYVADGNGNTVTVFDTALCNAADTAACGRALATITVGPGPSGIAVDTATGTLYVTNAGRGQSGTGHTVSVVNAARCNATNVSGCGQVPATVSVGRAALGAAFDAANQTVYVTDSGDNSVSMINAQTCHAGHTAGCGQRPPTVQVGKFPVPVVVDPLTGTVYVGNNGEPTVSVINAATCNATDTSGCKRLATLHVQGGPDGLAINEATHTLFVANNGPGDSTAASNTISVVNTAACNARVTSGCELEPPSGFQPALALVGANPGGETVDEQTDTLYVTTSENALSVVNGATCSGFVQTGCGQPVPTAPAGGNPIATAVNPVTHTVYAGDSAGSPWTVVALNTADCSTVHPNECDNLRPAMMTVPALPGGFAVDQATDTLYVANNWNQVEDYTVSVINGALCNGTTTTGCGKPRPTITFGGAPGNMAIDGATRTLYVTTNGTLSVVNAATCNARDTAGCGQTPAQVRLGNALVLSVAVDQATDTIYALQAGTPGTVAVINGATCSGTVSTGCGWTPQEIPVGNSNTTGPDIESLAVDQATDTVYVVNITDGTVSIINGATCNGTVTTSCSESPRTIRVGRQYFSGIAIDQETNLVYVSNGLDDTVSVINGNSCNGHVSSGCRRVLTVPAGAGPASLAVDSATHVVYVDDQRGGTISFFRFQVPGRSADLTATVAHGAVDLRWQPADDGGLPIVYHVITSPACPGCHGLVTPFTSGEPFTVITGLTPGQRYTFTVRASDAAGTGKASAPSSPVTP